jgi:hypothetical protein
VDLIERKDLTYPKVIAASLLHDLSNAVDGFSTHITQIAIAKILKGLNLVNDSMSGIESFIKSFSRT